MDFIIGSVVTLVIVFLVSRYIHHLYDLTIETKKYRFSQSSLHEMIKPLIPPDLFKTKQRKTQSIMHEERTNLRVIVLDGFAYWIKDNKIYEADIINDGIDKDSARVVDTMSMDKVQLDKIVFIVDTLREGLENDSGDSGN
jgi:hypothetical protein